jgi:hypothetical protein
MEGIMAKGLAKLSNAANRMAAINDFDAIWQFAINAGQAEVAGRHMPPHDAGWRTIDKSIVGIRKDLAALGIEAPPSPSAAAVDEN